MYAGCHLKSAYLTVCVKKNVVAAISREKVHFYEFVTELYSEESYEARCLDPGPQVVMD
jgi:hypothetical protein